MMKKRLIASLCALIIIVLLGGARAEHEIVLMLGNGVNMRLEPGAEAQKAGESSHYGQMFDFLGEDTDSAGGTWYRVPNDNGDTAWVSSAYAQRLELSVSGVQRFIDVLAADCGCRYVQAVYIDGGSISGSWCCNIAPDTKIRVASLSKILVAMEAMSMHERGIIDVHADISAYLGVTLPGSVCLRDMLTHTSGLHALSFADTWEQTAQELSKSENWSTGGWYYNNFAVGVAGTAIELYTRTTLEQYAKVVFFEPLGMQASWYSGSFDAHELAPLYYSDGTLARSGEDAAAMKPKTAPGQSGAYFAGSLTVSAVDFAKLICILASDGMYDGRQYLLPESVEEIERVSLTASDAGGSFGQAMPLRRCEGLFGRDVIYYHTGNAYGVLALASYAPISGDGAVVLTVGAPQYRDSQGIYAVCSAITEYLYRAHSLEPEPVEAVVSDADVVIGEEFSRCA